jgi:hypothetical protein
MKLILLTLCVGFFLISCAKEEEDEATTSSLSAEAAMLSKMTSNVGVGGESALANVTATPGAALTSNYYVYQDTGSRYLKSGLDAETACKTSGGLDETVYDADDALFPLYNLYCLVLKRPDGPDTVRGVLDRTSGWLCATGNIVYDGTPVTKTITISTACFSQSFVDTAATVVPTGQFEATVTGYDDVTGVAPASFEKYFTFVALMPDGSELVNYTIAVKSTDDQRVVAVLDTDEDDATNNAAFAVFMDKSTGVMKVEGRFPQHNRHFRFHMEGTLSSSFELENVEDLHFINAESSEYQSLSGTPAAGRWLRYDNYPGSLSHAGDGICYGETGAACTGNQTGLVVANGTKDVFTLASGHSTSATWFSTNSYLGSTGDLTADPDADIWP